MTPGARLYASQWFVFSGRFMANHGRDLELQQFGCSTWRLDGLIYCKTRYGLDNLIHVARNPSVARTNEPK